MKADPNMRQCQTVERNERFSVLANLMLRFKILLSTLYCGSFSTHDKVHQNY
ncbi:hypothetical protein ACU8KH_00881 [Lachancea thermotolerans]